VSHAENRVFARKKCIKEAGVTGIAIHQEKKVGGYADLPGQIMF